MSSIDAVSSKCRAVIAKVNDRPCKTDADCKLSAACDQHDDVKGSCEMHGPNPTWPGTPRFCRARPDRVCDPPWILDSVGRRHYKPECVGPETSPSSGGSASECRHARGDHMEKSCTSDRECASATLTKACPGVPMTIACERGHCRSRRTDGCEAPFEVDADGMRRLIVDCVR